jgi:hypothetical protein
VNRYIRTLVLVSLVGFCPIIMAATDNLLMAAVLNQVNKVSKKPIHKSPVEYRQAVERYIAATKTHSLSWNKLDKGKVSSYEIELQYLFNNYGRFSTSTLLYRLRSAHQELVKINYEAHTEKYQHYEQLCSALLLQCAQMLSDNARRQLLDALHEVDDLIIYWRYQKNHPLSYCFGKSPHKWITGKTQEKEVNSNIKRLEYKQAELYTTLGKLTAHAHSFTECGMTYDECYTWIEELFSVLLCIKNDPEKTTDGTRFDKIAAQLELKTKSVSNLRYHCLSSIASAKKSNHFVRNWIAYTIALSAAGYVVYYHSKDVPIAFGKVTAGISGFWYGVAVSPMSELATALSGRESNNSVDQIEISAKKIKPLVEKFDSSVEKELNKRSGTLDDFILEYLKTKLENVKVKMAGCWYKKGIDVDVEGILADFKKDNFSSLNDLCDKIHLWNYDERVDIELARIFWVGRDLLKELKPWAEIVDTAAVPLFRESTDAIGHILDFVVALARDHKWTSRLATFSPLAGTCFGVVKSYQWATARDYSPIRIALADVNSLLIESPMPLDDYDYGKLVYLVHKLRNKASSLKDALCNEFLADITKLESKRFDVVAKRGIVENMFNKYAFLGRITA